jgi:subtilase family protein
MTANRRRRSLGRRRTTAASAVAAVLGLVLLLTGSWLLAGLGAPGAPALGRGQWVPAAAAADGRGGDVVAAAVRSRIQREGRARVLVELRTPTGVRPESELPLAGIVLQRNDIAVIGHQVLARLAGRIFSALHKYETVPLLALEVGADALAELEASTFWVARVLEDEVHAPGLSQSGPLVGADQAWARGFDGSGWVVAILDTGVDAAHPFVAGRVAEQACFSSSVTGRSTTVCPNGQSSQIGSNSARPCSLSACWHGTHVAGIAAGNGPAAGQTFSGMARGAQIMAIQVFSSFTQSSDCGGSPPCALSWSSDFIAGLEYVYTRRTAYNIASANLSLGGGTSTSTCDGSSVKPAIDNLRSAGIATVISAGNSGAVNAISSPACVSTAISVGATNKNDTIASYSNLSFFTSLLAPGTSITSSFPGTGYGGASGTSMAAPHVTGTWAVLKQAVPSASVTQILTALQNTGLSITDTRSGGTVTKQRIRIAAALDALSPSPTLGVSPASVAAGGSVTATWAGITSASASDWIGLYSPSAADTAFIARIYVGCGTSPGGAAVPSGSCPFPVPGSVSPGGYELRLFSNNTFTRLATSGPLTVTTAAVTLSVSPASVAAGGSVTATWGTITGPTPADWIGLYTTTAADTAFLSRIYVGCGASPGASGVATGSCAFPIAGTVTPGTYQLRLFSNNGFTRLATSGNFTVTAPSATSLSASPASMTLPASVTATWSGIPQATASSTDWIGLYAPSASNTTYRTWVYVSCSVSPTTPRSSGSCAMTLPSNLTPGTYELRLFSNNGFTRLATSNTFAVVAPGPATLGVSPSSVVAGGSVTATWSNIPAPSSGDWIGLFAPGSANTAFLSRIYVGCGAAPSGSGAASGSCPFAIAGSVAPAPYQLRLFASSGALLATSSNFTVTAPVVTTVSASPSSVVAGGSLTATWSGIPAPSSGDWIGLFTPGSANAAVLTRVFVGCGPNPSGAGAASGSCPFGIPGGTGPGSYQLRLFASSGALLATSSNFTVTAPVVTTLAASPTSVVAGGSITAAWSGIASPTSGDWIGLYTLGSANASFVSRIYVGCGASPSGSGAAAGSCPLPIGSGVAAGTYQLRLFANNGFTLLATSGSFTVTAPSGTTVSASPTSVARGGVVTAAWSGIASPKAGDWIGIFAPGASNSSYVSWMYVSCTQVMTSPRASGSCPMGVPAGIASGTYQIRLFTNNTYTVIGTSNAFTVTP